VFHCKDAVAPQPDYSRAARVVHEMMDGHEPNVWISDRYSAQQKHGAAHQTCLAHLARDAAFALEHGSDDFPRGSSCGLEGLSIWPGTSPVSKPRRSPTKSARLNSNSRPFSPRRQDATLHASCKPKSGARETSF
jgi:hypothetical protein